MDKDTLTARLAFIRQAERLKDTLRSAHTTQGRVESVAEHTWRLTLLAMTLADLMPELDQLHLLKLCVLHDLGEAVNGDIPAPLQDQAAPKGNKEREDFLSLLAPLPGDVRDEFLALWDEYENASSREARMAKALDKLETLIQHNQGLNPEDFDYPFNLGYGRRYTDAVPLVARIREMVDEDTAENARRRGQIA